MGPDRDITSSSQVSFTHGPDTSDGQEELDYSCCKRTLCSGFLKTAPISTLKVPDPSFLGKSVLLNLSSGPVETCHCSHRQMLPGGFYIFAFPASLGASGLLWKAVEPLKG